MPRTSLRRVAQNLFRDPHGNYYARLSVRGKIVQKSLETKVRAKADEELEKLRNRVLTYQPGNSRMLFSEMAERWLKSEQPRNKPSSWQRLQRIVVNLNRHFGDSMASRIRYAQVEAWSIQRAPETAPRTYNYELETLNLIFGYGIRIGALLKNPAAEFERRPLETKKITPLTREQFRAMIDQMRRIGQTGDAPEMAEFMAYSGARIGETQRAKPRDVNTGLNTIKLHGWDGERVIPLFPALKELIGRIMDEKSLGPDDPLFASKTIRYSIETACERAGVPRTTHHGLRHFFASNAIEEGIDFKVIAEWLGHKDGGVLVARTYGHLRQSHSEEMAKRMTFAA